MNTWNAPHAYQNFPSWQLASAQRHNENNIIAAHFHLQVSEVESLHDETRKLLLALYEGEGTEAQAKEIVKRHEENKMIAERYNIRIEDVEKVLTKSERKDLLRVCKQLNKAQK